MFNKVSTKLNNLSGCSQILRNMVSINPTLVETVSINYEDFNESFLTCGTCLCIYDGAEHTPKLLPCSHTVCLHCLLRIAASHSRDIGAFRCPICRELINIPRGGIPALPPSFLVNQLLDLMSRQRRHIIPNCSVHSNQELLFCETCDLVFCSMCSSGTSHNTTTRESISVNTSCEHTIVPFSIAIKRMSEILLYKANECLSKLNNARDTVSKELEKLEATTRDCVQSLEKSFQDILVLMDKRKSELMEEIEQTKASKQKVLEEQLALIEGERVKVEQVCEGLQYQVEVRTISQRISSLSGKLDNVSILVDPRENSYVKCDISRDSRLQQLKKTVSSLGKVVTTTTLPSLSSLHAKDEYVINLEAVAVVKTVDYHGNPRITGGDPVSALLQRENASDPVKLDVTDNDDGTYLINFRPTSTGQYCLNVNVLGRSIKNGICYFGVTEHNNPVYVHGSRGSGKEEYLQPVAIAIDNNQNLVYIMDTGNSRIKVLTVDLEFLRHIDNPNLHGRSCTGIALFRSEEKHSQSWLAVVNWRSRFVTRINMDGDTLSKFTHDCFQEPISVAIDKYDGHIFVADNGRSCIFIFNCFGDLLFKFGRKGIQRGCFNLISSVCIGHNKEIVVADSRIQIFSPNGNIQKELIPDKKGFGRFGGITVDDNGLLIATYSEKTRHYIQVYDMNTGDVINNIDSHSSKLRRPSGLVATLDRHIIVADLGNDTVKKYRYF